MRSVLYLMYIVTKFGGMQHAFSASKAMHAIIYRCVEGSIL